MYPIVICEDQLLQLNQIEMIIQNFILFHNDLFQIKLKTQSPEEVEEYLQKFTPIQGIYFLDIDLNHTSNGIDLAEKIRMSDAQAKIIFITTHEEMIPLTVNRRVETLGFINKNQDLDAYRIEIIELLKLAHQRIDSSRLSNNEGFTISIGTQLFTIKLNEIYFIEPSELPHRLVLHTKNGQYEFYGKLIDLEKKYSMLVRINRSCLANLSNVNEINFKTRSIYFNSELIRSFSIGKASLIKNRMNK